MSRPARSARGRSTGHRSTGTRGAPSRSIARSSSRGGSGGSGGGILQLQSSVGNKAVVGLLAAAKGDAVISRAPTVTPSATTLKPLADVQALKIADFNTYANEQASWASEASLVAAPAERDKLVATLEFARSASTSHLGDLNVKEVADTGLTPDVRTDLRSFATGVESVESAGLTKTGVLADARRDGAALTKLEAAVPKPILHLTMGNKDPGKAQMNRLITLSKIDQFANYYTAAKPALEADDGADIRSYLEMDQAEHTDAASFVGKLPHVHNYHRFMEPMLTKLVANEGIADRAKPLMLILHSGSDHNGAFHRDAQLTETVKHPRNLTIMVEGAAKLEDLSTAADDIAKRQGQGGKIGQVMLAGHGDTRLLEMAGSQQADGTYKHDQIDLDKNKKRSEAFLKGLVANMAPGPDAHILLNVCLNAADQVNAKLPKDPKKAKAMILAKLKSEPSLASRLGTLAPGVGVEGNVSSVGAGQYMAVDPVTGKPTGTLHGTVAGDPAATSTDRGEYIEKGQESEGCLRAVVALWALDNAECMKRIDARLATAVSGWDDQVVHTFYKILKAHPTDISFINRVVNSGGVRGLSDFDIATEQTPESLAGLVRALTTAELKTVFADLHPATTDDGRLAIDAMWMTKDHSRDATFMAELDARPTAKAAEQHLSDWVVSISSGRLLPLASAAAPTSAQAKLALYGVTGGRFDPSAVAFLKKNGKATLHLVMPAGAKVEDLSGSDDEDTVLVTVGLKGAAAAPTGATTVTANFDSDGDGTNDIFLESITRFATVNATVLNLRKGPSMKAVIVDTIPAGEKLYIFGRSGDWYAAERPAGGTGFVNKRFIKGVPVA